LIVRHEKTMVRVYDDAELLRLAAAPPRDVAPVLRRAHWFTPLVVLLAVVPVWLAWQRSVLDEETAWWGLRALGIVRAERLAGWLEPSTGWPERPLNWAPPLPAWLTAVFLWIAAPGAVWPLFVVPALSVVATTWLFYRLSDEAGGTRWAFLSTACLALHPQVLMLVQSAGPDALCLCLLAFVTWGLWGHWVENPETISFRLLIAGVSWGLLLLAGGPLALAYLVVLGGWWLWNGLRRSEASPRFPQLLEMPVRAALFTLSVLIATGGALGFWWLAMMLTEHGLPFLSAWLAGRLGLGPSGDSAVSWGDAPAGGLAGWLNRSAFLGGWWVVGVVLAVRLARSRGTTPDGDFARWLLVWNGVAALLRCGVSYAPASDPSMARLWETFAILPATWLAAYGLDRTLRREVSWRWVLAALSLLVGQTGWLLSGRLSFGVMLAAAFAALVLVSAPVITGLRRASLGWNEVEIRRWVVAATLATFFGHAALSWQVTQPKTNGSAWLRLQQRLRTVEGVSLVSLIVADRRDSPELRYLLHSLWPRAVYSQASGWDPQITETLVREREQPRSRMVVVEWNRQDLRLQADLGSGWQVTTLLEPEPYLGCRLAAHLLAPAER
jgi:hypothetical protein